MMIPSPKTTLARLTGLIAGLMIALPVVATPFRLTYSGRLTDSTGKPYSGAVTLRMEFYRSASGGTPLAVTLGDIDASLANGMFQVEIDLEAEEYHSVFNGRDPVWIQVTDLTHNQAYPRQSFHAIPYALKVPIDPDILTYNADGELTLASPPEDGKFLTATGGTLHWGSPAGTGDMKKTDYDSNGDGKVNSAVNADSAATAANATQLGGQAASYYLNASNIGTGTLAEARIPASIARDSEIPASTDALNEGSTNRYYSDSLARGAVGAAAPLSYNTGTGVFSMGQASGSTSGYLSSGDFNTFNNKQDAITGATNITVSSVTANGEIKLNNDAADAAVTLKARDNLAAPYTLTLPADDGDNGNLLLTDGNGNLQWAAPGGGGDMFAATYDGAGGSVAGVVDLAENASALGGNAPAFYRDASNINAGTLGDAYIPAAITRDTEIPAAARAALSGSAPVTYDSGTGVIGVSAATTLAAGSMSAADKTKLDGIEAGADVTDAANVAAAGAVMDGDFSANGLMKRTAAGAYTSVPDNSANWDTAFSWGDHGAEGYIRLSDLSATAPLSYNNGTGAFNISQASGSTSGYLSSGDFNTFSNKQDAITGATSLSVSSITANGDFKLADDDASAVVTIKAKDTTTASYTLTLPDNDGDNGYVLRTDGSGNLSWISPGGGGDMFAATYDGAGGSVAGVVDLAENASALGGNAPAFYRDASNINAGTLGDAYIPAAITRDTEIPAAARAALSGSAPVTYDSGTGVIGVSAATTLAAGSMSAADKTKLDGIEAGADVTDAANVAAAGAVMDGDFSANGVMKRTGAGTYTSGTISNSDVDAGAAIATTKLSGAVTSITGHGLGSLATASAVSGGTGGTITDGTVTNADISNTASIDSSKINFANDGISGDKVHAGTISSFASTGIDDNADALAITIDSAERVGVGTTNPVSLFNVNQAANTTPASSNSYGISLENQGSINLTLGSDVSHNYVQSWQSKPLRINYLGNNVLLNEGGGNTGVGVASPAAKLDVGGGVKVSNDAATCDSSKAGTIRWTGSDFQGCNGASWLSLTALSPALPLRFTRTAISDAASDATKDAQCTSEFGANYEVAKAIEVVLNSNGAGGLATDDFFFVVKGDTDPYRFATANIVHRYDAYSNSGAVACILKTAPLRVTDATVAYNAAIGTKDSACTSQFGSGFLTATPTDAAHLAGVGAEDYAGNYFNTSNASYSYYFPSTINLYQRGGGTYGVACVRQ